MKLYRIIGWFLSAVLALMVGLSSQVIANQSKSPATAYRLGFGPIATARANFAFATFAARKRDNPNAAVSDTERRLAFQSLRSEPLSSAAFGILVVSMTGESEARLRQSLLEQGGKLTRRSSLITSASIEATARRGDDKSFFIWLSRALLTDEKMRSAYIAAMAEATSRDGAVEALAPVVGRDPMWSKYYWTAVLSRKASLLNAAKLRATIAQAPWHHQEIMETDRLLARALVANRQFDAARQLAVGLGQVGSRGAGQNLLTNGDFSRRPLFPPFDWQLATSGSLGASISAHEDLLTISAIAGAYGYATRQLVELAPGSYVLGWDLSGSAAAGSGMAVARLACAENAPDPKAAQSIPLKNGAHKQNLTVPADACRWYWLSVDVAVPDNAAGMDLSLRNISLVAAPSAAVDEPAMDDANR